MDDKLKVLYRCFVDMDERLYHTFQDVAGNFNHISKALKHQKKVNKSLALLAVLSTVYLIDTRKRCIDLEQEVAELKPSKGE